MRGDRPRHRRSHEDASALLRRGLRDSRKPPTSDIDLTPWPSAGAVPHVRNDIPAYKPLTQGGEGAFETAAAGHEARSTPAEPDRGDGVHRSEAHLLRRGGEPGTGRPRATGFPVPGPLPLAPAQQVPPGAKVIGRQDLRGRWPPAIGGAKGPWPRAPLPLLGKIAARWDGYRPTNRKRVRR
jgi:hypothetical protein